MNSLDEIPVWDIFIRVFHWSLVLAFLVSYLTEDDVLLLHVWAGYFIGILIVARIVWGFVGSQHARFSDFVRPPKLALDYLKASLQFRAQRYVGHNPIGGLMVVALLLMLAITVVTGTAVYAVAEQAGPLASFLSGGKTMEEVLEEVHEFFANFTLFLVMIHVIGAILESWIHHENLILAMVNGKKRKG